MREIKFRAWNGKYMIDSAFGDWVSFDGVPYTEASKKFDTPNIEIQKEKSYKLMQFTGLKDKNGKEIYEGDVVRTYMGNICEIRWDFVSEKTSKQDFEYTGFCFHHLNLRQNFHLDVTSSCEVIGNIYEHKELLNDSVLIEREKE